VNLKASHMLSQMCHHRELRINSARTAKKKAGTGVELYMNYTRAIDQLRRIRFGRKVYLPRDPDDRAKIIQERLDLLKIALT
jgi:hypothetical protein